MVGKKKEKNKIKFQQQKDLKKMVNLMSHLQEGGNPTSQSCKKCVKSQREAFCRWKSQRERRVWGLLFLQKLMSINYLFIFYFLFLKERFCLHEYQKKRIAWVGFGDKSLTWVGFPG